MFHSAIQHWKLLKRKNYKQLKLHHGKRTRHGMLSNNFEWNNEMKKKKPPFSRSGAINLNKKS